MILDKDFKHKNLEDVFIIQKVVKDKGFYLSLENCAKIWRNYSIFFGIDWLFWNGHPEDIWNVLLRYNVIEIINETRQNKIKKILE
jgi:hypothetical protein